MKQTIEIEVPEGKKAIWKDNKIVFENIIPKTWKEFCDLCNIKPNEEYYIDIDSTIGVYVPECNLSQCSKRVYDLDRNLLPSRNAAEAHLALMQLHQLRDYYRQGWKPKESEIVFSITRRKNNIYKIEPFSYCGIFLSFQTNKLAQEFFYNFEDLIKQADDLI